MLSKHCVFLVILAADTPENGWISIIYILIYMGLSISVPCPHLNLGILTVIIEKRGNVSEKIENPRTPKIGFNRLFQLEGFYSII